MLLWSYSIVDSMHSISDKTRKSGHSPTKAALTSAMAFSQVVKWYLPWMEGLHLEESVSCWTDTRLRRAPITAKPVWCFFVVRVWLLNGYCTKDNSVNWLGVVLLVLAFVFTCLTWEEAYSKNLWILSLLPCE